MGNKPQILAEFKSGKSIGSVEHFAETMNWLVPFVSNLKGEEGISIKNPSSDHPLLELNIAAGKGIKITKSNGRMTISATEDGDDDDDTTTKKGGGSGSGSGGGVGSGGSGGGSGLGGSGGEGDSGSGSGSGSGGGEGSGNDCNQWSDDLQNGWGGGAPSNDGDSCVSLNGW